MVDQGRRSFLLGTVAGGIAVLSGAGNRGLAEALSDLDRQKQACAGDDVIFDALQRSGILREAGSLEEAMSRNDDFSQIVWLNSGEVVYITDAGVAVTRHGTPRALRPSEVFELVGIPAFDGPISAEMQYFTTRTNLEANIQDRAAWKGAHIFPVYTSERLPGASNVNRVIVEIRRDGEAKLRKNIGNRFMDMGSLKVFDGEYNAVTNPNLVQDNLVIGLKGLVLPLGNGNAQLEGYIDVGGLGNWQLISRAVDDGVRYGQQLPPERTGIQLESMDALVLKYLVRGL